MDVQGKIPVHALQEEVWTALNDPAILQKATPGCKSLTEVEPDHYKAEISLGVSSIKGEYLAEMKISEKTLPVSLGSV
ncbi:hypothetical protein GCM10011571_07320 [Marinithermofilum abyssi]|jgi:uncharacterized protein|uniref:Carbon monoxide dehydrogenase n=1 Tax=Marinithermofilum abyssi TaxID=1571185 RepID=A0A8J2VCJ0_9BACL|nr:SRPBCC domain-containing protein [Marinithermofilum abyssi]GGE08553.1 hypothetical protein GCM10011571_07320 [Marinithermofilum abyssi]